MDKLTEILTFLETHKELINKVLIALGAYELLARFKPTEKNWSLIDRVWKLLTFFLPNRRKPQPDDILPPDTSKKNLVDVPRTKHIVKCLLPLLFVSSIASAQLTGTFRAVRYGVFDNTNQFVGADTTFLNLTPNQYPVGTLIREINSDTLYYKFPDGFWHPITGGGSGGSVNFANTGLNLDGDTVKMGGTYAQPISIFSFNASPFSITTGGSIDIQASDAITLGGGLNSATLSGTGVGIQSQTSLINIQASGNIFTAYINVDTASVDIAGTQNLIRLDDAGGIGIQNDIGAFIGISSGGDVTLSNHTGDSYVSLGETLLQLANYNDDVQIIADDVLDLQATTYYLNGSPATSPTTEFFRGDGTWAVPAGGSGATADNGLTETAGNIQLGGTLIQNTTIPGDGFDLSLGIFADRLDVFRVFGTQTGLVGDDVTIQSDGVAGSVNVSSLTNVLIQHGNNVASDLLVLEKEQTLNSGVQNNIVTYVADVAGGSTTNFGMEWGSNLSTTTGTISNVMNDRLILTDATTSTEDTYWTKSMAANGVLSEAISVASTNEHIFRVHSTTGSSNDLELVYNQIRASDELDIVANDALTLIRTAGGTNISIDLNNDITFNTTGSDMVEFNIGSGTSFIIMNGLPSNCTGVPTNGLANVSGTLTVCP